MSIFVMEHLTHQFGEKLLYKDSSLRLNKGDHLGLTGQNGVGKSTLIKLLTGELLPDEGRLKWQKNIRIGYLDQYAQLDLEQTIEEFLKQAYQKYRRMEQKIEKLYMEFSKTAEDRLLEQAEKLQIELDESDYYQSDVIIRDLSAGLGLTAIGLEKKIKKLSGGQRSKVILAKLLLEEPEVLLLDEPTNYLDDVHIQWLVRYLQDFTGSFVLVSHDYKFLDEVTNCIGDIEFGKLTKYTGNLKKAFKQKEKNKESYLRQYHAQQVKIEKAENYIRKYGAGTRATIAKSRQKQLDKMERFTPPTHLSKPRISFPYQLLNASLALTVSNLQVGFSEPLLTNLDFSLKNGEKVALKGFNGIGKSTLIKTLVGELPPLAGEFSYPANTEINYFSQELYWENRQMTALHYLNERFPKKTVKECRSALSKCGLPDKLVNQPIQLLSGGEQTKIKLCELTLSSSNFIYLDEPTNHIDEAAKESLQRAIREFPGTILIVSHEQEFYESIVDRVMDVEKFQLK